MLSILTKPLAIAEWMEDFIAWISLHGAGFFAFVEGHGKAWMSGMTDFLLWIPPLVCILLITAFCLIVFEKKWHFPCFAFVGLLYIYNQGLWTELMNTIVLVGMASFVSVLLGVPLGICMAKSERMETILKPILDFMQTMPSFVYLIPAVAFFGIGMVPGVFASIVFALPPTVRFTNLALREISLELIEVSRSFGTGRWQQLFKIELPLAKNTILAGINQTVMLALSMVVTASMIGAPGLGRGVLSALQRAQVGNGFVNGLALVVLAIIIDRLTQRFAKKAKVLGKQKRKRWKKIAYALVLLGFVAAAFYGRSQEVVDVKKKIRLSYVAWDSEVASSNVMAEVLRQEGYEVECVPLDNGVMWESIAMAKADAMVCAWLPGTHEAYFTKYKNDLEDLGPNLAGAKIGLVVPAWMEVSSIADLKGEAGREITGIEAGAGIIVATERALKEYPNLADWKLHCSSTGAMTVSVKKAMEEGKEIVITGWTPHWLFSKYDLKYLEDPRGSMGGEESIHTMARLGLKEEDPRAYAILDAFHWKVADMEAVMLDIHEGMEPEEAAKKWIAAHEEEVKAWCESK